MSIDIDWHSLTTGPSGQDLADSIRDFIHDKFQQVQLPRFIRSVNVHSFTFGDECPIIEIKDISDPLDEFYEDDEESTDEADDDEELPLSPPATNQTPLPTPSSLSSHHAQRPSNRLSSTTTTTTTATRPSLIDTRLPSLHHPGISTPFLSRSTTPNVIPGVSSNLSYFHLPLSAGLSGTQTPLLAPWQQQHDHHHDHHQQTQSQSNKNPPSSSLHQNQNQHNNTAQQQQHHHPHQTYADPSSRPSTSHTLPPSRSPPFPSTPTSPRGPQDKTTDIQLTLRTTYTGTLSLLLTAEILLDYPMPSFVGIPLKLQITGLSFDGVALLAYLRGRDSGKGRVCFCFLEGGEGEGEGEEENGGKRGEERGMGGLLREIRVESEIGRQEDGKVVLKNVGKVEKFVLEQVRRIFEDEFVWPSFWTFLV